MMAPQKRTRLGVDERRGQLLDAAADLLATRQPEQISVDDLARAAGVSTGLLYHYFPSKREFLLALTRSMLARARDATSVDPGVGLEQAARSAIRRFLDYITDHRTTFLALHAAASSDPELSALIAEARDRRVEQLLSALGKEHAETAVLRAALASWVLAAESLCLQWARGGELERDELEQLLTELLFGAYTAAQRVGASAVKRRAATSSPRG
jgi:AcrR family transcriptional regulator